MKLRIISWAWCMFAFNVIGQPSWTLDRSFKPPASKSHLNSTGVETLVVQPDGKLLVSGSFWLVNGKAIAGGALVRLNVDGSLDSGFEVASGIERGERMTVQPDGKILLAGGILVRLNADGTRDSSFQSNLKTIDAPFGVQVRRDGKIVVFGNIFSITNAAVVRLHADGTLDLVVEPNVQGSVYAVGLLNDGKIIIGGVFDKVDGVMVLSPDGGIFIAGAFDKVNGASRIGIARLRPDGTLDDRFDVKWSYGGLGLMLAREDGGVLLGGSFTHVDGWEQFGLAFFRKAPSVQLSKISSIGGVQLLIGGEAGWTYRIETSTGLVNWTLLREVPSTGAVTQFTDVDMKNQRFYRVRGH